MLTRNVFYSERPETFSILHYGTKAVVSFSLNVSEVETEEGTQYLAEEVYSLETIYTPNLAERIEENLEAWLNKAKEPEKETVTLSDIMEAINTLTDIVIGGEF